MPPSLREYSYFSTRWLHCIEPVVKSWHQERAQIVCDWKTIDIDNLYMEACRMPSAGARRQSHLFKKKLVFFTEWMYQAIGDVMTLRKGSNCLRLADLRQWESIYSSLPCVEYRCYLYKRATIVYLLYIYTISLIQLHIISGNLISWDYSPKNDLDRLEVWENSLRALNSEENLCLSGHIYIHQFLQWRLALWYSDISFSIG